MRRKRALAVFAGLLAILGISIGMAGNAWGVTYYTHTGRCVATPSVSHGQETFSNYGTQSVAPYSFLDDNYDKGTVGTSKWTVKMVYNGTTLKTWTFTAGFGQATAGGKTPPPSGWRGAASLLHMNVLYDPVLGTTCSYNIQAAPAP